MKNRIMLTIEPTNTMIPANKPLFADLQSTCKTKLLDSRFVGRLQWPPLTMPHFPIFCQIINNIPTVKEYKPLSL